MPHDPTDAANRLKAFLAAQPTLGFAHRYLDDHPGAELYLVGGAVRDAILGRRVKDVDLVARGRPREEIERWLSAHGTLELVGKNFGVYKFLPTGFDVQVFPFVDIALPRREHASEGSLGGYREFDLQVDPNLPIENDLERRDFTVNALAYDLRRDLLIDPTGGLADLHAEILRAVGDPGLRFGEDLSRLLRGIRFAAQLDFEIEENTWIALGIRMGEINKRRVAGKEETYVVPRETIGAELAKAFAARPGIAAELLQKSGAFKELLPEVDTLATEDPSYLAPLSRLPVNSLMAAFALLLRDVPLERVSQLVEQVGLPTLPRESPLRVNAADVAWLVEKLNNTVPDVNQMRPIEFERAFMNGHGTAHFACLDALGRTEEATAARERAEKMRSYSGTMVGEKIPALVSGNDAIAAGLVPGPHVRLALERVRDAQLEGKVKTRATALTYLKNHLTS